MKVRSLLCLAALFALLAFAAPAAAKTWHVHAGQSIQAAIDAAHPGDTIVVHHGVYHENLIITKNHLSIRGEGKQRPVLRPGTTPVESICSEDGFVNGICVAGSFDPVSGEPGAPTRGTTIARLRVRGFTGFGIVMFLANDTTVRKVIAADNGGYGISGFVLHEVRFFGNVAHDNGEPGFYIGDSPNAEALVVGNRAFRNGVGSGEGFGFLLRDSSDGVLRDNRAWGNCVGIVFADTGENPDPVNNWRARHNRVRENNAACTGEEGGGPPPLSGIGVLAIGTHRLVLAENRVFGNAPSGPSAFSGGIALVSGEPLGGAAPTNNRIARNTAFDNEPADIFWDESGNANRFVRNHCGTSQPSWICD